MKQQSQAQQIRRKLYRRIKAQGKHVLKLNSLQQIGENRHRIMSFPTNLVIVSRRKEVVEKWEHFFTRVIQTFGNVPYSINETMQAHQVAASIETMYNNFFKEKQNTSFMKQQDNNQAFKSVLSDVQELVYCSVKLCYPESVKSGDYKNKTVSINFEGIDDDGCQTFHQDFKVYRLCCTYLGPSTQYVHNTRVVRRQLYQDVVQNSQAIKGWPKGILNTKTGDVIIMKGAAFPNNHDNAIVHRSPPVLAKKQVRVFFKVDVEMDKK